MKHHLLQLLVSNIISALSSANTVVSSPQSSVCSWMHCGSVCLELNKELGLCFELECIASSTIEQLIKVKRPVM